MREGQGPRKEPKALATGESVGFWARCAVSGLAHDAVKLPPPWGTFPLSWLEE